MFRPFGWPAKRALVGRTFASSLNSFLMIPSDGCYNTKHVAQCRSLYLRSTRPRYTPDGSGSGSSPASPASALTSSAPSPFPPCSERDRAILRYPYEVIQSPEKLEASLNELAKANSVALDIEAFCTSGKQRQLGTISLMQACSDVRPVVFLFDVLTLTSAVFVEAIRPLLESSAITKLFFDCRRDVEALSCQMGVTPRKVLDLQLQYTALQWKLKSNSRRSGMTYVLKQLASVERQEGDSAVQTAMTLGNRPVWDVRPLPEHFLEYAAGDVRHIFLLEKHLQRLCESQGLSIDAVERLTASYVESYSTGKPVTVEPDSRPAEVNVALLERFVGPGGCCAFCGAKGHTETECFKKDKDAVKCSFCGAAGHTSRTCFKKNLQLLKCDLCGEIGHSSANCFKTNPCKYCGGFHSSANCHQRLRDVRYFNVAAKNTGRPTASMKR